MDFEKMFNLLATENLELLGKKTGINPERYEELKHTLTNQHIEAFKAMADYLKRLEHDPHDEVYELIKGAIIIALSNHGSEEEVLRQRIAREVSDYNPGAVRINQIIGNDFLYRTFNRALDDLIEEEVIEKLTADTLNAAGPKTFLHVIRNRPQKEEETNEVADLPNAAHGDIDELINTPKYFFLTGFGFDSLVMHDFYKTTEYKFYSDMIESTIKFFEEKGSTQKTGAVDLLVLKDTVKSRFTDNDPDSFLFQEKGFRAAIDLMCQIDKKIIFCTQHGEPDMCERHIGKCVRRLTDEERMDVKVMHLCADLINGFGKKEGHDVDEENDG